MTLPSMVRDTSLIGIKTFHSNELAATAQRPSACRSFSRKQVKLGTKFLACIPMLRPNLGTAPARPQHHDHSNPPKRHTRSSTCTDSTCRSHSLLNLAQALFSWAGTCASKCAMCSQQCTNAPTAEDSGDLLGASGPESHSPDWFLRLIMCQIVWPYLSPWTPGFQPPMGTSAACSRSQSAEM